MIKYMIISISIFIIAIIYLFVIALCKTASDADKQLDYIDVDETLYNSDRND